MHDMQSIARDGVAWSVFALVTTVSLAKTDAPFEMLFEGRREGQSREAQMRQ